MRGNGYKGFRSKLGRFLARLLLLPLAPLLGWGPFTHIEVARLAWQKIRSAPDLAGNDLPRRLQGHGETFARAAPSADVISAHHVLKQCPIYDYMHNWMPDNAHGIPRFGYALVHQCLPGPPRELAVACGWLAHQMADWWAHYAPIATDGTPADQDLSPAPFRGYANSFRVMGTDFFPEILDHYRVLDHALLELLYDLMVISRPGSEGLASGQFAFFSPAEDNALTRTSERWAARLPRVPPHALVELRARFARVMRGLVTLYSLLRPFRSLLLDRVDRLIAFRDVGAPYLERCAQKIVEGVFQVTGEEIAQWGSPDPTPPQKAPPLAVRSPPPSRGPYPGTPLLDLAGWLGGLESEVDTSFLTRLGELARAEPAGPRPLGLTFLLGLATAEEDRWPDWLYHLMPPAISLLGLLPSQVEANLADALRSRELTVVFVPAARLGSDLSQGPKALDPASLRVTFNGYDVDRHPEYFRVEKHCQEGKVIWYCRLLQPAEEGYHYLWATGRDRSGVTTLPFHYVVNLSAGA